MISLKIPLVYKAPKTIIFGDKKLEMKRCFCTAPMFGLALKLVFLREEKYNYFKRITRGL